MADLEKAPERKRRDWIIILIILLIGFICVILAGGWAIRFSPTWKMDTDMGSNIDPDSVFLTSRPSGFLEPLDPSILTQPVWINVFLTPGASFPTNIPVTSLPTSIPLATNTTLPTAIISPTNTGILPSPTNTSIYFPPPTNTPRPPQPPTNTPIPSVDLAITKDDGNLSYTAGGILTYTITIINNGPNNVTGAVITDNKPANITTWSWACTSQNGGASGCNPVTNSSTNFTDAVDLPNGASIVYTVTANVSGGATGILVNTATISVPTGYSDTVPGNNFATDTDTLTTANADLSITKDDSVTIVNTNNVVIYTVRITNNGPDAVVGAILSDPTAAGLNKTGVLCSGTPGQCITPPTIAQLEGGTFALPTLANGQFYEISISASVTATSGNVTNTAAISAPAGINDPNTANNAASDIDVVASNADLWIEITDNATDYVANSLKTYTITVTNIGPDNVTGAIVSDIFSTNTNLIPLVVWGCSSSNGGSCTPGGGIGDINNTVNLPNGSSVTYTALALVVNNPAGPLVNTATVTAPVGTTDPVPGNNSATDTDTLFVSSGTTYGNIGTGSDGSIQIVTSGSPVILTLSPQVQVDGGSGPELIYYEQNVVGGGIDMDRIILEIGDGSNWYPVLNWGDGNVNTGTNIISPWPPSNSTDCSSELDNCPIDAALLADYLGNGIYTGITIDLDALVPTGTYSYIRITVPAGSGNAGIDGIYVVP